MNAETLTFFEFESDFIEDNIRCIPMLVRFKLDACGVKLKLIEWCRMNEAERQTLVEMSVENDNDCARYKQYLVDLIHEKGGEPMLLAENIDRSWANRASVPDFLKDKARALHIEIPITAWSNLGTLQRFALTKLASSQHESKNLPKALNEFGLR